MGGFAEAQAGGQACEQNKKCGKHPRENNPHLPFLGQAHGGAAARDRVHDDHEARADDGEIKSPAQHTRQNDGRGVNGDARGETALEQK